MKKYVIILSILLSACAGRTPQPVALVQPIDKTMSCSAMYVEVDANNKKVSALSSEEGEKVAQNLAAGVVGLFVWPVWFAMDFQGTASKEVAALQARQQYLATMMESKKCTDQETTTPTAAKSTTPDNKT